MHLKLELASLETNLNVPVLSADGLMGASVIVVWGGVATDHRYVAAGPVTP